MEKKRNQTFVYLYALAIIMVIDDHCGTRINILSNIFPYNSFYMPLFVFSSGYFFYQNSLLDTVQRKVKKIFIPYIVWCVVAILLSLGLDLIFGIDWTKEITAKRILFALTNNLGPITSLNGASWFMIMLFWVSIGYAILRALLKTSVFNDVLLLVMLVIGGFFSIWICMYHYPETALKECLILFVCRTVFYLQFYHLGYMFRTYFEKVIADLSKMGVCLACILTNVILILIFDDAIIFNSTSEMHYFNSIYLPLVTSVTGIIFYYEIMTYLSGKMGENRLISFIGRNTLTIMQIHLLLVNIPNFFIYCMALHGTQRYSDFPIDAFIDSAWVRYSGNSRLLGFFCGLFGSLLVAYVIERIKDKRKILKQ